MPGYSTPKLHICCLTRRHAVAADSTNGLQPYGVLHIAWYELSPCNAVVHHRPAHAHIQAFSSSPHPVGVHRPDFCSSLSLSCVHQADTSNRGYHPFGLGTAKNPYQQLDRKEAWNGYLGWEDDAVETPFRGQNRWPDEELLPGFRPAMTAYYHAMNGVAER